ncbi:tetratricopeptide repeat protein [Blattabacterium cuenoti]|uniref:tetratricopeptide repeat protein n=1 Tax=Blattabacterium cuenoti TaxID=1653831 RepID=UPI00163D16B5|nr:hypothetical protein [Blattabacterium cuenoti]
MNNNYFFKKKKIILFFIITIFIIIGIYFFYKKIFLSSSEEKALKELIYAQKYLSQGVIDKAINNKKKYKNTYLGFSGIITKYPYTKAGNIAKFYASICYYKLGNYKESIKIMNTFYAKDEILSSIKYGIIGDSLTQMNNKKEALKNYLKAANIKENEITTPLYYYKAALLAFYLKKYQDSKFFFKKIKKKYPLFLYKDNVDKYLMFIENKL